MYRHCPDCDTVNATFSAIFRESQVCSNCKIRLHFQSQIPAFVFDFLAMLTAVALVDLGDPVSYIRFCIAILVGAIVGTILHLPFVGVSKYGPSSS